MPEERGKITFSQDVIYPRYDPAKFVGREWLVKEIARFRDSQDGRLLTIVGKPGSGKSALIAYLAETWNCPRHFIRVDNIAGATGLDPRFFFISLGWQLRQKYGVNIFENPDAAATTKVTVGWARDTAEIIGRVIDEIHTLPFLDPANRQIEARVGVASGNSRVIGERVKKIVDVTLALDELALLRVCLIDPLRKVEKLYPREKVVILIDALDESAPHAGRRIIDFIPSASDSDFPSNLRLVMTSRIAQPRFSADDCLFLDDRENGYLHESLKDARKYIERRLAEPPLSGVVAEWPGHKLDEFRAQIEKGSDGGNFLYLFHLFNEFADQAKAGAIAWKAGSVPKGLDGIYRFFAVEKIKSNTGLRDWIEFYLPLLGALAVAREPVSREQLARFAGVSAGCVDFIVAQILQFLDVATEEKHNRYRFFHNSFSDYLLDQARNRDYPIDGPACHYGIALSYRSGKESWSDVDWSKEKDPYVFRNLAAHLAASNRQDELYELVAADKKWADAHFGFSGSYSEYINDLEQVLAWAESPAGWNIGRQIRCALIKSSVHSLAGNLPAGLLRGLIETKIWTPQAALSSLDSILNEEQRADALLSVLPLLTDDVSMLQAVEVTRRFSPGEPLIKVLTELAKLLPEALKPELLSLVDGIRRDSLAAQLVSAQALGQVVKAFPDAMKHEALGIARRIKNDAARAAALLQIAPNFPDPARSQILEEARSAARKIPDPKTRAMNLGWLTTRSFDASGAGVEEFLEASQDISDPEDRIQTLIEPGRFLPDDRKADLARRTLEAARGIADPQTRADRLLSALDILPAGLRDELSQKALDAIRKIDYAWSRSVYLIILAGYASGDLQDRILGEAKTALSRMDDDSHRIRLLVDLFPYVPQPRQHGFLCNLLEGALNFDDDHTRASLVSYFAYLLPADLKIAAWDGARDRGDLESRLSILNAVIDGLPPDTKWLAIQETFEDAKLVPDAWKRASALGQLASRLDGGARIEAIRKGLHAIREMDMAEWQVKELGKLAPILPPKLTEEAMETALSIAEPKWRAEALIAISTVLQGEAKCEALREALAACWLIGDEPRRVEPLAALAALLPEAEKSEAMREAWLAIAGIPKTWERSSTIRAFVSRFQGQVIPESLDVVNGLRDEQYRALALAELSTRTQPELASKAMAVAASFSEPSYRSGAFIALAERVPPELKAQAISNAMAAAALIKDNRKRARAFCGVAERLPDKRRAAAIRQAFDALEGAEEKDRPAEALMEIEESLTGKWKSEAVAFARRIKNPNSRAWALRRLAGKLPPPQNTEVALEALKHTRTIQGVAERAIGISGLLALLPETVKDQAWREVLDSIGEIESPEDRARIYNDIAVHTPADRKQEILTQALETVKQIREARSRIHALKNLAPNLTRELKLNALAIASEIHTEELRIKAVIEMLPILPAEIRLEAVRNVLTWVKNIRNDLEQADTFRELAAHLPGQLPLEALATAREIRDDEARSLALAWIATGLPEHLQSALIDAACEFQSLRWRAIVLIALAGRMPRLIRYTAITGRSHSVEFRKTEVTLPESLQSRILSAAREMAAPSARALTLLTLAPLLPNPLKTEVMSEIMADVKQAAIATFGLLSLSWAEIFAELASCWETINPPGAIGEIALWRGMASGLGSHTRPQLMSELASLAPVIKRLGGSAAITETFHAIRDVSRWYR